MASLRVLTFNFHEPYMCMMAKIGLPLTIGVYRDPPLDREWQTRFRPIPRNITIAGEPEWRRDLDAGKFDVVVAHNETNAANLFHCQTPKILVCHNRRSFLATTVGADHGDPVGAYSELLRRLKERFTFVFISESKRADYGIDGPVIPPGIDVEEYGGYSGDVAEVLRVGNMMRTRNLMFDVDFQEEACRGLPNRVVGEDPLMPEARPSSSFDELLGRYRTGRCLLHVTRQEYEDGYNLSMLEAMACGMPVVALENRTSPLTDGVDGFVAPEAHVLRARLQELLSDQERAKAIGAKGRETAAARFPMTTFIERWREAIEKAAEQGARTRRPNGSAADARPDSPSSNPEYPSMRIAFDYSPSPDNPGGAMVRALRKKHKTVSLVRESAAESRAGECIVCVPEGETVQEALGGRAGGFTPDLYLRIDTDGSPPISAWESLACPKALYLCGRGRSIEEQAGAARGYDFVYTEERGSVAALVEAGVSNVAWLPPGAVSEDSWSGPDVRDTNVVCIGGGSTRAAEDLFRGVPACVCDDLDRAAFASRCRAAKIAVVLPERSGLTGEVLDAMAAGAMVIARSHEELAAAFEPGVHLMAYMDLEEIPVLVKRYLGETALRERIAAAGKAIVLERDTCAHRAEQAILMILDAMGLFGGYTGESRFRAGGYYRAPRPELAAQVPPWAKRILDCGCGGGEFGRSLKQRGASEVVGIEIVERAWAIAKRVLDDALLGNIEEMELPFEDGHFDCIVFGDVLEHLVNPTDVLRKVSRVLASDGQIVMSIPNVRFWGVVDMLAGHGRWTYADAGILDRTHLRFFTAAEMVAMAQDAGLKVLRIEPLSMWPSEDLKRNADGSLTIGRLTIARVSDAEHRDFCTYQYLVVAGKPEYDGLARARRALEEGDYSAAYQNAEQAHGVDEASQKRIMARAVARLGKLDTAERLYREAMKLAPGAPGLAGELGIVLVAMNRARDAEPLLLRARDEEPENERVVGALGLASLAQGNAEAAFDYLRKSLDMQFDNESLVAPFLQTARQLGRLEEAEPLLRRFVEYYPGKVRAGIEYVRLLRDLGRITEARDRAETVVLLAPGQEDVTALMHELDLDGQSNEEGR